MKPPEVRCLSFEYTCLGSTPILIVVIKLPIDLLFTDG